MSALFDGAIFDSAIFDTGAVSRSVWLYGEREPEIDARPETPPDPRNRPTLRLPSIGMADIRASTREAYSPADVRNSVAAILRQRREDDEEAILLLT